MEKRKRGRPPRYPKLIELQKWAHASLKFEDIEGDEDEVYIRANEGEAIKGCNFSHYAKPHEDAWVVKFSFAGQQYTIATLRLYDACSLYDCLLVWFEKYRRQRPSAEHPEAWFNFTRSAAEYHIESNQVLADLLRDLEKFFNELGVLKTAEQRLVERSKKDRERKAPYSLRGMLNQNMAEIFNRFDEVDRKLDLLLAQKTTPLTFSPGSR